MAKETKEPKTRVNGVMNWEALFDGLKSLFGGKTLRVTFTNGDSLRIDPQKFSPEVREAMFWHGVKARIGDKGAVGAAEIPDKDARMAEIVRRMRALVEHYHSGTTDWDMRTGAVGPRVRMDLIHRAMAELELAETEAVAEGLVANLAKVRNIELAAAYKLFQDSKDVGAKVREYLDAEKTYTGSASEMLADLKKAAG